MKTIVDRPDGSKKVSISFPEDEPASRHRAKQEFWKDCSINHIMKKYRKTGILGNPLMYREGVYGDFTSGEDYFSVLRKVTAAQRVFDELPSHIRSRFANDPAQMIDFLVDSKNDEEAIKLGLKVRSAAPEAPKAAVAPVAPSVAPPVAPKP